MPSDEQVKEIAAGIRPVKRFEVVEGIIGLIPNKAVFEYEDGECYEQYDLFYVLPPYIKEGRLICHRKSVKIKESR